MLNNIFLFTGGEKYLLDQELSRWEKSFAEKFWKDAIFSFNSENFDIGDIKQSIFAWGLFIAKKLIIIHGLPTDTDASNKISVEIAESLTNEIIAKEGIIPGDTILAFVSYKPDKRGKLYKFLGKNATIKEFKKLSPIGLKNFAKKELEWVDIDINTIEYFLIKVGDNLYRIINEWNKLKTRYTTNNKRITNEIVDLLVFGQTETNWFIFFDNFFDDRKQNLNTLRKFEEEWTNRNQFMWTLCRWLKLYLYMLDMNKQWITDSKTIASIIKIHPFAINKNLKNIQKIKENEEQIRKFYQQLIVLDNDIKTGKVPDTYFRLWVKKMMINTRQTKFI